MTVSESNSINPNPYQPVAAAVAPPVDRWRWLLAGVIGIVGGYLAVSSLTYGPALNGLLADRFTPDVALPWIAQGIFALAVTSFAFLAAPGALARRVLGVVVFVVLVVVVFLLFLARLSGAVRGVGPVLLVVTNQYWGVLFAGALGWLIAVAARPIAYLALLLTFLVMPLSFVFALANISSGISSLVQLVLSLVIAAVILLVSRPAAGTTVAPPADRWRWLLAGVLGILGGYLTVSSVTGGLANVLAFNQDWEIAVLLVGQAVFALAVTSFAFLVAPGTLGRRVLAVVLFVVITVLLVVFIIGRISGTLRFGGPPLLVVTNSYWIVLVAGGLGWLIAAGARPLAYLSLLLTLIVMPLGFVFTVNNITFGISSTVQLVLSLVIAAVILLVSRPAVPYAAPVAAAADSPATSAADLAPTAFVAMDEGAAIDDDAPRTPAT